MQSQPIPRSEDVSATVVLHSTSPRALTIGPRRLLRFVTLLWVGYIMLLRLLDHMSIVYRPTTAPLPSSYYGIQLAMALAGVALTWLPPLQRLVGPAFLPLLICFLGLLPSVLPLLLIPNLPPGPITGTPGLISLRALPMVWFALVLVASYYRWYVVVLYCLGVPLLNLGAALWMYPDPLIVSRVEVLVALLQALVSLIAGMSFNVLSLRLRQNQAALEQANLQLRNHISTLQHLAMSQERNRVARELHDTLAHTLSGLVVQLETAKAYLHHDPPTAESFVTTALDMARTGVHETRRALKALRARPLEDLGLRLAVIQLAEIATAAASINLELHVADDLPILPWDTEQAVYRIAQEAIANSVQHARASSIRLWLTHDLRSLTLRIEDNGSGFVQQQTAPPGHFGIAGMHERAALVGGTLTLHSQPGRGTTVQLVIPR